MLVSKESVLNFAGSEITKYFSAGLELLRKVVDGFTAPVGWWHGLIPLHFCKEFLPRVAEFLRSH